MGVCAFLPFFITVSRHVKSADETFLQVCWQPLQSFLLYLPYSGLVLFTIGLDMWQSFIHIRSVGPYKVHAAGSKRRDNDIDLGVSSHVDQVSHEISKLAAGLRLLKTKFAEPCAEHANRVVHVRAHPLNVVDQFVPLLTMHYLPYTSTDVILLVDFAHRDRRDNGLLVSFCELVVV